MEMGANKRSERRNVRRPCSASENGPINKFCVWRILLSKSGPDERLKCFVARARICTKSFPPSDFRAAMQIGIFKAGDDDERI